MTTQIQEKRAKIAFLQEQINELEFEINDLIDENFKNQYQLKQEIQLLKKELEEKEENARDWWLEMNRRQREDFLKEKEELKEEINEKENELEELKEEIEGE